MNFRSNVWTWFKEHTRRHRHHNFVRRFATSREASRESPGSSTMEDQRCSKRWSVKTSHTG
ncbi:uncharacterized protein LOC144883087 isoform X5 [Branchiostoma floridae x Branchiostoma japonicum]